MPDSNPVTSTQVQQVPSCFACDGCKVCEDVRDCCSDCVNEVGEAGDLFYCECEGHACGPSVDYLKKVGIDDAPTQ